MLVYTVYIIQCRAKKQNTQVLTIRLGNGKVVIGEKDTNGMIHSTSGNV